MSMTIIPDVIGGAGRRDGTGLYVTRLFRVKGTPPGREETVPNVIDHPQLPVIGRQHPRRPEIVVTNKAVEVGRDRSDIIVRVEYGPPDSGGSDAQIGDTKFSVRTDMIDETVTEDINGNRIFTRYVSRLVVGSSGSSVTITDQTHQVDVQKPTFSLVWSRLEAVPAYPLTEEYSGFTNGSPWQGKAADQWLMTISSNEEQARRHRVEYAATFSRNGWQAQIEHSVNGRIPLDVSKQNGISIYQMYPRADFRRLQLEVPS